MDKLVVKVTSTAVLINNSEAFIPVMPIGRTHVYGKTKLKKFPTS